jgi:hypothetical protein
VGRWVGGGRAIDVLTWIGGRCWRWCGFVVVEGSTAGCWLGDGRIGKGNRVGVRRFETIRILGQRGRDGLGKYCEFFD